MNTKQKQGFIRAISFLSVAAIILAASTIFFAYQSKKYEIQYQVFQQKSMNELCEALDNISVSLQKAAYCGTAQKLMSIGNDLTRQGAVAKTALSQLTDEELVSDEIYKFLSQIGAYTLSLSQGGDENRKSDEAGKNIDALIEYSKKLSSSIQNVVYDYDQGNVSLWEKKSTLSLGEEALPKSLSSSLIDAEQSLTDYPTLIYDGPFADNILNRKGGECLKELDEVTKQEAKNKAAQILSATPSSLRQDEDTNGSLELYCFSKGDKSVGISKKGGKLCYYLSSSDVLEETISASQAIKRGKKFLENQGYDNMTESYYSVYDGVCTVNFAYSDEGAIYYADLIKVSVALDSGEVTAFDATGYLVNHCQREKCKTNVTEDKAIEKISPNLSVIGTKSAVIPLDTGKEAHCYEFHCKDKNGSEALIYIDKETGEERDVLLLLYSDGGTLTR